MRFPLLLERGRKRPLTRFGFFPFFGCSSESDKVPRPRLEIKSKSQDERDEPKFAAPNCQCGATPNGNRTFPLGREARNSAHGIPDEPIRRIANDRNRGGPSLRFTHQ